MMHPDQQVSDTERRMRVGDIPAEPYIAVDYERWGALAHMSDEQWTDFQGSKADAA